MYFWMLLGCLAVGVAGWALNRRFDRAGQALMSVGALGCVGLIAWQGFQAVGDSSAPRVHRSQAAVAYILAHHLLGHDDRRSGDVVLLFPPDDAAPPAALDSFFEGFARVIDLSVALNISTPAPGGLPVLPVIDFLALEGSRLGIRTGAS